MKKNIILLATTFLALNLSAQNKITLDSLNSFKTLQINGKIELFVTMDEKQPVSMNIEMNGNDPNQLRWWEEAGAFQIKYSLKSKGQPIAIRLNCHSLDKIDIQAASVTIESIWRGSDIVTINLTGNSKLTAEVYCKDIKATTQASSVLVLKGSAIYADFDTRSKSKLDARNFEATSVFLGAWSYSESFVYGKERLIIDVYDGSSVFYRGNPAIMRQRSVRGGHTNPIGE